MTKAVNGKVIGLAALSLPLAASFFAVTNAQRHPVWFLLLAALTFLCLRPFGVQWSALDKRQRILCGAFSLAFAVTALVGGKVVVGYGGHFSGRMEDNYLKPFGLTDLPWTLCFALLALALVLAFLSLCRKLPGWALAEKNAPLPKRSLYLFWFLIFLFWLPYLIAYYPGLLYGDSAMDVIQALTSYTNAKHPLGFVLLLRLLLTVGDWIADYQFGCLLFTLFQMLLLSYVFAKALLWMNGKGCRRGFCYAALAFFALTPLMPMHAISMWKDPLFAGALLLLAMLTYDVVASGGALLRTRPVLVRLGLYTLAICFIRNNGVAVMIPYWLCLFLVYGLLPKRRIRGKAFGIVGLCCLAAYLAVVGPVYSALGVHRPFQESVCVPLQQIARVGAYHGDVTPEQQEFLYTLCEWPYAYVYSPCCVDPFKEGGLNWNYLNANQGEFLKYWVEIGLRNPRYYLAAYVLQTYELWSVGDVQRNFIPTGGTVVIGPEKLAQYGIAVEDKSLEWFGASWRELLPVDSVFPISGVIAWFYLAVALALVLGGKGRFLLPLSPALFVWLGLTVGTPLVEWRRYMLPAIYALPLTVAVLALAQRPAEVGSSPPPVPPSGGEAPAS